jgi:hypothetical protein
MENLTKYSTTKTEAAPAQAPEWYSGGRAPERIVTDGAAVIAAVQGEAHDNMSSYDLGKFTAEHGGQGPVEVAQQAVAAAQATAGEQGPPGK